MPANRKLTPILAGRTIQSLSQADNLVAITFTDGSILKIKTSGPAPADPAQGHTVLKVRQSLDTVNLDFTDQSTLGIPLAEPTSSVMLRDAQGQLEYAD